MLAWLQRGEVGKVRGGKGNRGTKQGGRQSINRANHAIRGKICGFTKLYRAREKRVRNANGARKRVSIKTYERFSLLYNRPLHLRENKRKEHVKKIKES